MPGYPAPMSGGAAEPPSSPFGISGPKAGGEIQLSRAEAVALRAYETDEDEKSASTRARRESGLTAEQLKVLRQRADKARNGGYTLKAPGITLKPKPPTEFDEPGLLGRTDMEKKADDKKGKVVAKGGRPGFSNARAADPRISKAYAKTREARVRECGGDMDCPCMAHRKAREVRRRAREAKRRRAY